MPPRPARKPARRVRRRNPVHSRVRDLPASLRSALDEVGYGRADIELRGADTFTYQRLADDGERAFTLLVNMATGENRIEWGTYGSGDRSNRVDADRSRHPIPPNGAVIQGVTGRGHPVWATITVHPSNLAMMLPAPAELSEKAQLALEIIGGYTSKGRIDEFEYRKLGKYGPANPLVQELAAKGLVKVTASGVQITTEGKSARRRNPGRAPRRNPLPAGVITAALTLLPYIVSALGRKLSAFNALPRADRKAKLVAMLNSRWLYLSPAILPVARWAAKSDVAMDTLIDALAGHGQAAVKAGGAAAQAALAAKGGASPRPNPAAKCRFGMIYQSTGFLEGREVPATAVQARVRDIIARDPAFRSSIELSRAGTEITAEARMKRRWSADDYDGDEGRSDYAPPPGRVVRDRTHDMIAALRAVPGVCHAAATGEEKGVIAIRVRLGRAS